MHRIGVGRADEFAATGIGAAAAAVDEVTAVVGPPAATRALAAGDALALRGAAGVVSTANEVAAAVGVAHARDAGAGARVACRERAVLGGALSVVGAPDASVADADGRRAAAAGAREALDAGVGRGVADQRCARARGAVGARALHAASRAFARGG